MKEYIEGYQAPIYRAIWARILTAGVPHQWFAVWLLVGMFFGFVGLLRFGVWGVGIATGVWGLGQVGMMWLTRWDPSWDDIGLAHLTRRYKGYYEA